MTSPFDGISVERWRRQTLELIAQHPLSGEEIYEIVLKVWADIFSSGIGSKPFRIGEDIFPTPQIMGFFLHELIALELEFRYPGIWRRDHASNEKDLVYIPDDAYSIEIKTSWSGKNIYGNRSYAQLASKSKKNKSGYCLAINFAKFTTQTKLKPQITLVRFGWLDHDDWIGQTSATGQQARLSPAVETNKLITLPITEQ